MDCRKRPMMFESLPSRFVRAILLAAVAAISLACGDYGGGAGGASAPLPTTTTAIPNLTGDPALAAAAFQNSGVYTMLTDYCVSCHAGAGPGSPHIAHPDLDTAYHAVVDTQKVNFVNAGSSRLVRRLIADFHHCWTNDCVADGLAMEAGIVAWAAELQAAGGGSATVQTALAAGPMTLAQGVEDLGAERYSGHQIAFWDFKEGAGTLAHDTSPVGPPLNLVLEGPTFMSGYGIDIQSGRALGQPTRARKLYDRIAAPNGGTQQFSVEAWVTPDNTDQEGPARIISYSASTSSRNFTVGQVMYNYNFRNRNFDNEVTDNGEPALQTYDADQDLQATLQHVVMTYDQLRGRRIYVNGTFTDDFDEAPVSRLWNWDPAQSFILGNELSGGDRQWVGQIRLLAVYDHALTQTQIQQNFDAGVGKRLILRFDVSPWIGPGGQLEFLVTELDDYSYLFCMPTLLTPNPGGFRVANLRLAVNGVIAVSGQAFPKLDAIITSTRQVLSQTCSVVLKDQGPDDDVFTVEIETLGNFENPVVVTVPPPAQVLISTELVPAEGLRDFARINESMVLATGVDPLPTGIDVVYDGLKEQLPGGYDLRTVSSANQVGVAKLALEYCDALVETGQRDTVFPGFDFTQNSVDAFDTQAERDLIIQPLIRRAVGENLTSQPSSAELTPIMNDLIAELTTGCTVTSCLAQRTQTVVKGVCAAMIGSAAATIH